MKNGVFQIGERAVAKLAAGRPIVEVVGFDLNRNENEVEFADGSKYWYNVWDLAPVSSRPYSAPNINIGDLVLVPWTFNTQGEYIGRVTQYHAASNQFDVESLGGTVSSWAAADELRRVTDSWVNDPDAEIDDICVGDEVEYLSFDPTPTVVVVESRIFDDEYLILFPEGRTSIWCTSDELGLISRNGARLLFAPTEQTRIKSTLDGPFPTLREFLS